MSKVIHINGSANTQGTDCGNTRKLTEVMQDVATGLQNMVAIDQVADSLAMGWNFYHRVRKEFQDNSPYIKPDPRCVMNTFNGLRFYLDERVPPNECHVRNRKGEKIASFKI